MAFFSDSLAAQPRQSTIATFFAAIGTTLEKIANAQNRSSDVQRMQNLTDQELAALGIAREDILRYVYRDLYYI